MQVAIQMLSDVTYCPKGFDEVVLKQGETYSVEKSFADAFVQYKQASKIEGSADVQKQVVTENPCPDGDILQKNQAGFVESVENLPDAETLKTEIDILRVRLEDKGSVIASSQDIIAQLRSDNETLRSENSTLSQMIIELETKATPETAPKPKRGRSKKSELVMKQRQEPAEDTEITSDGELSGTE